MNQDESIKNQIVTKASQLFLQYGIKRVTMDDIAQELGISKKTIYQHFKDKEEIITTATRLHMLNECEKMRELKSQTDNAVEHLHLVSKCMRESFSHVSSSILYDLKKYYKEAWNEYLEFEQKHIYNTIVNTLKEGIEEGYFRPEIDPNILATLRMVEIRMSFDKELFDIKGASLFDIQSQLLDHFTYGILTEKGLRLLESYKKQLIHEK